MYYQDVKKVYRKQRGEYILTDCVFAEDWDMEKRRMVAKALYTPFVSSSLTIVGDA